MSLQIFKSYLANHIYYYVAMPTTLKNKSGRQKLFGEFLEWNMIRKPNKKEKRPVVSHQLQYRDLRNIIFKTDWNKDMN